MLLRGQTHVEGGFKNFAYFVQKLYSAEILGEDAILDYYTKLNGEDRESYKQGQVAVAPFVSWLQQQSSDSDDDDEGEAHGNDDVTEPQPTKIVDVST